MKTIRSLNDLTPYGIKPLTGEACGLMYRILCDVTESGRKIVAKTLGIPQLSLPDAWNRGSATDPHIGSIMLAPEMYLVLAVFALLEAGCIEVWQVRDDGLIGIESDDSADMIEASRRLIGDRMQRSFGYRGTAGDRNRHQMSGRVE